MPGKVDVEHASRLAAHLLMQRELGKYCDVCVCVGDQRFLAHKCVLSANSSKLDGLILDAIGQNSSNQDIEIEIQGVSPVGFETLLEHFYTGELNLLPQTVMPVWMTAAYLELPGVVSMCNDYCQRSVTCVSNQSTTEEGGKVSDLNNNNNSTPVVMTAVFSSNTRSSSAEPLVNVSTEGREEATASKYSQMTTVTASLKESTPSGTQPQHRKILTTDESAIAWTPLQTATGEEYQANSNVSSLPQGFQYPSVPQTWSQTQESWAGPTYENQQIITTHTYTAANSGHIIKEDPDILEDGEITINSEPQIIQQPDSGVGYMQEDASDIPTIGQPISIIDVNKLSEDKSNMKPGCENIMLEVERLRIQHQQLQRLQQQQASLSNTPIQVTPQIITQTYVQPTIPLSEEPAKKKAKKKKYANVKEYAVPTPVKPDVNDGIESPSPIQTFANASLPQASQPIIHSSVSQIMDNHLPRNVNTPADFRVITDEYRESLYRRYPIKPERPMSATCTAAELLQRGKSRKRKSTEQNALNNTIRLILDTMEITESSDAAVEDALILIMDRFDSLRSCINDPAIRRSLLVKVRHSIHCKKWRVKRQMLKEKMDELGITSTEEYNKMLKDGNNEDSLHG